MGLCSRRQRRIPVAVPGHIRQLRKQKPDSDYKSGVFQMERDIYGRPDGGSHDRSPCTPWTLIDF